MSNFLESLSKFAPAIMSDNTDVRAVQEANNGPDDAQLLLNTARRRGNDLATQNQFLQDFETLNRGDLTEKYGSDAVSQLDVLNANTPLYDTLENTERSNGSWFGDQVNNVAQGLGGSIGGIAALGAGVVDADAGRAVAEGLSNIREYGQSLQSQREQDSRRLAGIRATLDSQDNENQRKEDEKTDGSFIAGLKSIGRDALGAASRLTEDPTQLQGGVAQGVGSLLAGGPVSKGVSALAGAGRVAGFGAAGAMPASIALMEAGGAYEQSVNEVLDMSPEDLIKGSEDYREAIENGMSPEDAKTYVANKAGQMAAAIQAPVALLAGKLVSKFEADPFAAASVRTVGENMLRETVEEGIQSASGAVAQNVGIQQAADENRSLIQDVGSQTLEGAVFGAGTAGAVQSPALAGNAVREGAAKAFNAAKDAVTAVGAKGDAVLEQNAREAEALPEQIVAKAEEAAANVDNVVKAAQIIMAEKKAETPDEALPSLDEKIASSVNMPEEEFNVLTPKTREVLGEQGLAPNASRIAATMSVAGLMMNPENGLSQEDKISAGLFLLAQDDYQRNLFDDEMPTLLEGVDQGRDDYNQIVGFMNGMKQLGTIPQIAEALTLARDSLESGKTAQELESLPVTDSTIQATMQLAQVRPDAVTPALAQKVLYQDGSERSGLTVNQRRILVNSQRLGETGKQFEQNVQDIPEEIVNEDNRSKGKAAIDLVNRQFLTEGGDKKHQKSLRQHTEEINRALNSGDNRKVQIAVSKLVNVARSKANKVGAINTTYETGTPTPYRGLAMDQLRFPKKPSMGPMIHRNNEVSRNLARTIHAEATAAANLANQIAGSMRSLGIEPVVVPPLDPRILAGVDKATTQSASEAVSTNKPLSAWTDKELSDREEYLRFLPTQSKAEKQEATAIEDEQYNRMENTPSEELERLQKEAEGEPTSEPVSRITPEDAQKLSDAGIDTRMTTMLDRLGKPEQQDTDVLTMRVLRDEIKRRAGDAVLADELAERETKKARRTAPEKPTEKQEERIDGLTREEIDEELEALRNGNEDQQPDPTETFVAQKEAERRGFENVEQLENETEQFREKKTEKELEEEQAKSLFNNLMTSRHGKTGKQENLVQKTFKVNKSKPGKLTGFNNPIRDLLKIMETPTKFVEFAGSDIASAERDEYDETRRVIKLGGRIVEFMNERLKKHLESKDVNRDNFLTFAENRAVNFATADGVYEPRLVDTAVIAALHWVTGQKDDVTRSNRGELAQAYKLEADDLSAKDIILLNTGTDINRVVGGIASEISRSWGLTARKNVSESYTKGLPRGLALEILRGLEKAGFAKVVSGRLSAGNTLVNRVVFNDQPARIREAIKTMGKNGREMLALALWTDVPFEGYTIGAPRAQEDRPLHQVRNDVVKLGAQQQRAQEQGDSISRKTIPLMREFFTKASVDGLIYGFGGQKFDPKTTNAVHALTLEGVNLTNRAEIEALKGLLEDTDDKSRIYFGNDLNRVDRLQMTGPANPQTNKFSRQALSIRPSLLDLSGNNKEDTELFWLAIGQGLGVKTNRVLGKDMEAASRALLAGDKDKPGMQPALDMLRDWEEKQRFLSEKEVTFLGKILGGNKHALGVMIALAQFENARDRGDDLTSFPVHEYVEADGISNGPQNGLVKFTAGEFTVDWADMVNKGGIFPGRKYRTANQEMNDPNYKDTYGAIADTLNKIKDGFNASVEDQFLTEIIEPWQKTGKSKKNSEIEQLYYQNNAFNNVMSALDITVKPDGNGGFKVTRNSTKNPATIKMYGSGLDGIAGNITDAFLERFYEVLTEVMTARAEGNNLTLDDAFGYKGFIRDFEQLLNIRVKFDKEANEYSFKRERDPRNKDYLRTDFELTTQERKNLHSNIRHLYVRHLESAMYEHLGKHVDTGMKALQNTTNFQSIALTAMFRNEIVKWLVDRQANPNKYPEYRRGELPSRDDFDAMLEKLKAYSPFIKMGEQTLFVSGSEQTDPLAQKERREQAAIDRALEEAKTGDASSGSKISSSQKVKVGDQEYTISMSNALATDFDGERALKNEVQGPAPAGVAGAPIITIASGDGAMIQIALDMGIEATTIFDGVNFQLRDIREGSRIMNEAVWETYNRNTMRYVAESFRAFVRADPFSELNTDDSANLYKEYFLHEITKQFEGTFAPEVPDMTMEEVIQYAEDLAFNAEDLSDQIEARIYAKNQIDFSVDQMASGETPYTREVDIDYGNGDEELTNAYIVDKLNSFYQPKYEELRVARGFKTIAPPNTEFEKVLSTKFKFDKKLGVLVRGREGGTPFRQTLEPLIEQVPVNLQTLARQAADHLGAKGYTLVSGTRENMREYERNTFPETFDPDLIEGNWLGKTDPVNHMIYLANPSPETFVHELIHGAVMDKINAYYNGEAVSSLLSQEDRDAIARLEGLMGEWLIQRYEGNAGVDSIYGSVSSYIASRYDTNKAEALNEFLAWVLSNQDLSKAASKTVVKNSKLRVIGEALKALSALIWGKRKPPQVGEDLLSNVRFNARVLLATKTPQAILAQNIQKNSLFQNAEFGQNDRLGILREKVAQRLGQAVVRTARDRVRDADKFTRETLEREAIASQTRVMADTATTLALDASDIFEANGLLGSAEEKYLFSNIVALMSADNKLDPTAMNRMQAYYAHVMDELTPESFVDKTNPDTVYEKARSENIYNVLVGNEGITVDKNDRSTLLSSFVGLALVDDQFRDIISRVKPIKGDETEGDTLDGKLETMASQAMDYVARAGAEGLTQNNRDALDRLFNQAMLNQKVELSAIEQASAGFMDRMDEALRDKIQNFTGELETKSKDMKKPLQIAARALNGLFNPDRARQNADGLMSLASQENFQQDLKELFAEVIGVTDTNRSVYEMISLVKTVVDQARQKWRSEIPNELKKSSALIKEDWKTLSYAMAKSDLGAVHDLYGTKETLRLVSDNDYRKSEIASLEKEIENTEGGPRSKLIKSKSQQLAEYMTTGRHGYNLLPNARAVAHLLNENNSARVGTKDDLVPAVDRLVTLYALDKLPAETVEAFSKAQERDPESVTKAFSMLMAVRRDELAKSDSDKASLNQRKGFFRTATEDGSWIVVANKRDGAKLKAKSYQYIGDYVGSSSDISGDKLEYYFAPKQVRPKYNQGVMQTVHETMNGIDPNTGYSSGEITAGRITDPRTVEAITRLAKNQKPTEENLIPVFGNSGSIIAYERGVDPKQLARLNKNMDLADAIGAWKGRQIEEGMARKINETLVDRLAEVYEKASPASRTSEFVALNKIETDPIYEESWSLVPDTTRRYIKQKFGKDFMIQRGMLEDVIGYRQPSIGDSWTGNSRWKPAVQKEIRRLAMGMFGNEAYGKLMQGERFWQELITEAKTTIVIRSIVVPAVNFTSNIVLLGARGVPIRTILTGMTNKTSELNTYIKDGKREIDLNIALETARGEQDARKVRIIEAQLKAIQDNWRTMSIWPLIEKGEFGSISDGGIQAEDLAIAEGRWANYVEKLADKVPAPMKTPARYALVTRDTALFKGLARATQYGDFLAKAVLYDHLVKKGMKPDDAVLKVSEEYINYNRLPGRTRSYAESVGGTWFWAYKLRSIRVAMAMARENPLRSLLFAGMAPGTGMMSTVGSPFSDNMVTKVANGEIMNSLGLQQLFRVPGLLPAASIIQ